MKKVLSVILAIFLVIGMSATIFADGSGKKDVGEHEHKLMKMANAACHYEECTICFELFNVGDHTYKDGKCTVCGNEEIVNGSGKKDVGEHEHKLMKMANAACHYEECTICFELFNVGDHTFRDGECTVCGHGELINPFIDVKEDDWYHDEVVKAVETGIINGKTETEFKPDDFLTYGEAVKLAACMNQVHLNGEVSLKSGEPWYQPYVDYCVDKGIITDIYDYDDNATRAGYMEIFANALPDEAFKEINSIPNGSILDVKENAPYAIFVYKLYRAGIVTGVDGEHNCNPKANIKRSEVATIISRMMDEGNRVKFDMSDPDGNKNTEDDNDKEIINKTEENEDKDKDEDAEKDNTKQNTEEKEDEPINIAPEDPQIGVQDPTQSVDPGVSVTPTKPFDGGSQEYILDTPLTIHKQPEGSEAEEYGTKYELEVQVFGGKAPYTYEWQYKVRRDAVTIKNGDYAKDAESAALVLSVEKENTLLGQGIYCVITDAEGTKVTTDTVKVYGPFSMPVDDWTLESGKNTLIGRVADGILKKGEKVSVIRDGKVIAIGVAEDLQMFNKSLDETVKGENVGIVFNRDEGVIPSSGDIVVKYQPTHVVDTSDIVN